jgi:hypothetical protein
MVLQVFSISDLAGWKLEASRQNHKCVWSVHAAQHAHSPRRLRSRATRGHAFSTFPKILLLSTAMDSLRKDLSRSFHASVHAYPPSPRPPKNAGPLCDKAGSSRSIWGRTKQARKTHLMTLSQVSMRSLLTSMYSSSMFRVLTLLAYGTLWCFFDEIFLSESPGISGLQQRDLLVNLLRSVVQARDEAVASSTRRPKLVLKISPDLDSRGVGDIADAVGAVKGVDGVIVSNTTVLRPAHLHNGARISHTLSYPISRPGFQQRIAQSKAVSPARLYNPSHSGSSATYASASLPKCP